MVFHLQFSLGMYSFALSVIMFIEFWLVCPIQFHFSNLLIFSLSHFFVVCWVFKVHKTIHITAVVVDEITATGRRHIGVCSGWLARQIPGTPHTFNSSRVEDQSHVYSKFCEGKTVNSKEGPNSNLRYRRENPTDTVENQITAGSLVHCLIHNFPTTREREGDWLDKLNSFSKCYNEI
jgi:hypothetical protein